MTSPPLISRLTLPSIDRSNPNLFVDPQKYCFLLEDLLINRHQRHQITWRIAYVVYY